MINVIETSVILKANGKEVERVEGEFSVEEFELVRDFIGLLVEDSSSTYGIEAVKTLNKIKKIMSKYNDDISDL
jgi:hypothetical protein